MSDLPPFVPPRHLLDEYEAFMRREIVATLDQTRVLQGKKPWSELTEEERAAERLAARRARRRRELRHPVVTIRARIHNHVHRHCDPW